MSFKTGKPAAAMCLYALLLLNMPLPPKCSIPNNTETMRYTGKEIRQPTMATLQAHAYRIFDRQRFAVGTLLLIGGTLPLLLRLFRHYCNRRRGIAGTKQDGA